MLVSMSPLFFSCPECTGTICMRSFGSLYVWDFRNLYCSVPDFSALGRSWGTSTAFGIATQLTLKLTLTFALGVKLLIAPPGAIDS